MKPASLFLLCLHVLLQLRTKTASAEGNNGAYAKLERGWDCMYPVTEKDMRVMRDELVSTVDRSYSNYLNFAFPMDNLDPISCKGSNLEGGMALTLIDSLDTLILMNQKKRVKEAVKLIRERVRFDVDHLASVFEVNIRALGGLLSAHVLLKRHPDLAAGYDDALLRAAVDVGQRLLPAFALGDTLPARRINMKTVLHLYEKDITYKDGVEPGDIQRTCTACAGTLLLEMGMLSRLTDDPIYEEKAKAAIEKLFSIRTKLGLLGSDVHVADETWINPTSTIGAGSDSFYEYLLKSFLLFGDEKYLSMFSEVYSAVMHNMKTPELIGGRRWLLDVDSRAGTFATTWICALSAFWPGLQALMGQLDEAQQLYSNYTDVWRTFAALPEMFSIDGQRMHPIVNGFGLRPELIESTYLLHASTKDPHYLQVTNCKLGRIFQKCMLASRTRCGHSEVSDLETGLLEDSMPSFFLAESLKYLYLLHSNATSLVDAFVFTTEAHLFPPVQQADKHQDLPASFPEECARLCMNWSPEDTETERVNLEDRFPLLRITIEDFDLLRRRRCIACAHVSTKLKACPTNWQKESADVEILDWAVAGEQKRASEIGYDASGGRKSYATPFSGSSSNDINHNSVGCREVEAFHRRADTAADISEDFDDWVAATMGRYQLNEATCQFVLASDSKRIEVQCYVTKQTRQLLGIDVSISQDCTSKLLAGIMDTENEEYDCPPLNFKKGRVKVAKSQVALQPVDNRRDAIIVADFSSHDSESRVNQIAKSKALAIVLMHDQNGKHPSQSVLDNIVGEIPIVAVSSENRKRIMDLLENGEEVQGIIGMTTSSSLRLCRFRRLGLQEIAQRSITCATVN